MNAFNNRCTRERYGLCAYMKNKYCVSKMSRIQNIQIITPDGQYGMTLLEMLVVVVILAAVAFVTTSTFDRAYDDTHQKLMRSEMLEITKAIKMFKQDTGFYPGQGPFTLLENVDADGNYSCADDAATSPGAVFPNPENSVEAFTTPANFRQLFEAPVLCDEHPLAMLANWQPGNGRGWRGPYLKNDLEYVDVGDDLQPDGSGSPTDLAAANPNRLEGVRSIADAFERQPVRPNSDVSCEENTTNTTPCLLDWRVGLDDDAYSQQAHGRPYLYFIDNAAPANIPGCENVPCLVSMGPNGRYDDADDLVVNIE